MPEEFFQKALHCSGFAGFGRKSFIVEKISTQFHSSGEAKDPIKRNQIQNTCTIRFFENSE